MCCQIVKLERIAHAVHRKIIKTTTKIIKNQQEYKNKQQQEKRQQVFFNDYKRCGCFRIKKSFSESV